MKRAKTPAKTPRQTLIFFAGLVVFFLAAREVFWLGHGSGNWLGQFSLKWAAAAGAIWLGLAALLALLSVFAFNLPQKSRLESAARSLRAIRREWRWSAVIVLQFALAWFIFYSPWGGLFASWALRLILFLLVLVLSTVLLGSTRDLYVWKDLICAGLIMGACLVLAAAFVKVSSYPFALHWSEGNRLWDYSLAFGAERYNYSGPQPIFAWIDQGRQTLWGLPFLIPNISIEWVRLWSALLVTLPYALLGWLAFRPLKEARAQWLLAGLWSLVFLNQGPIYTPLILAAILVALARRKPLWLALPLVYVAGHYAGISRFSWRFAPAIYVVILTFGDALLARGRLAWRDWSHAALLALAGIWSKGLPVISGVVLGLLARFFPGDAPPVSSPPPGGTTVETLEGLQQVTQLQPYVWERLLPNPVYAPGILLGLAVATLPLIGLLVWLAARGHWKTAAWQRMATLLGLGALLLVGVIASAKVGGGTDLHNLDMFLVGLVLLAALAWEGGLASHLGDLLKQSPMVRWSLLGMTLIPAFLPLINGGPLLLPSRERTQFVLERIQGQVACARQHGEVLLMDQRQLLTFGHLGDLPLVVDYEKKYVMDKALEDDSAYFETFKQDLASGRFSMIVTERQAILYKESEMEDTLGDGMLEENNAWVHWVTVPLLTHYESISDYRDAAVEIFMPKGRNFDCP